MAWNEPGGSKDKDPWGNRNKQAGPPDLDEMMRKLQQQIARLFGGGKGGRGPEGPAGQHGAQGIIALLVLVLVAWMAWDATYIIQPAERGVVLRFGKYVDILQPGPSIRLPRPIERVERIDVDQVRSVELGFRSEGRQPILSEALMLTQDENIVSIKLAVQYKVKAANDYLFQDRNPDLTLREAAESAVREVIGKSKMDFVLKEGRSEVAIRTQDLIQTILDRYKTGLQVTSVNLQDAQAPEQVQEAFLDAIRAREDQARLINEAEGYSNEVIPRARGEAARIEQDAVAYKVKVIAEAEGNASRFQQILAEYKQAPEVTRERLYLESIQKMLSNSSKVMIDVKQGSNLLYLPLDKLMERGVTASTSAQAATPAMPPGQTAPSPATSAEQDNLRQRRSSRVREGGE